MTRLSILFFVAACAMDGQTATTGEKKAASEPAAPASASPSGASAALPGPTIDPGTVVATWNGGQVTYGDLTGQTGGQVKKLEIEYLQNKYDLESGSLDMMIDDKLLEAEAKARGMDVAALKKAEISDKAAKPADADIASTMELMKRRMAGQPDDKVRAQTIQVLQGRAEQERAEAFLTELKTKYASKTTLPFPDLPRVDVSKDDDPMRGAANAKVTVIQFAEFQCPYCGRAKETVEKVLKNYDGKVNMVFRDFPLGFHDRAIPAAVAANCAGAQGKYWEMWDAMMSNQRALSDTDLEGYATKAGVASMDTWHQCLQDPAQAEEVKKDIHDGETAGVTGTPAFFINGLMISGAQPYEKFSSIIDRELAKAG
jgi:protein-disulfide isomerase